MLSLSVIKKCMLLIIAIYFIKEISDAKRTIKKLYGTVV